LNNPASDTITFTGILPAGTRLDHYLVELTDGEYSRSFLQKKIEEGFVLSGKAQLQKSSFKPKEDIPVQLTIEPEPAYTLSGNDQSVPILYQDEYLAIIHKPAGMTVHPGTGTGDDTLVHSLLSQMESLSEGSSPERPGIVHRLDRDTAGLMVIAKTSQAHDALSSLFAQRTIQKIYHAVVWGEMHQAGELNGFIFRHPKHRTRMKFIREESLKETKEEVPEDAKSASLSFSPLHHNRALTLLRIELHSGRTHQIRASFAAIGHPVAGDPLYGSDDRFARLYHFGKKHWAAIEEYGLMLHASSLSFAHPFTGKPLSFSLPLPDVFEGVAAEN